MRGDGFPYLRGNRWWIAFYHQGEKQRTPAKVRDTKTGRMRPARDEPEARKALQARWKEIESGAFVPAKAERLTVDKLLDAYVEHQELRGLRSLRTLRLHLKPIRVFFGSWRCVEVTTVGVNAYQKERREAGKAPATIRRELEGLRGAFFFAGEQTPPLFPRERIPAIPMPAVDNVRQGFFTQAEVGALLEALGDPDLCDFTAWAWKTGMRRGEIAQLTFDMLDTSDDPWRLSIPGAITKNKDGRSFGFDGEALDIMRRRVAARRLDCPLIFHRAGRPIVAFDERWKAALKAAKLPPGRLFHDLRRSAVRSLIRAGVDPTTAMKVSGHKTRSMLDRYNVIQDVETAAALRQADAWLLTQPRKRNVVPVAVGQTFGKPENSGTIRAQTSAKHRWNMVPEVGLERNPSCDAAEPIHSITEKKDLTSSAPVDGVDGSDPARAQNGHKTESDGGDR